MALKKVKKVETKEDRSRRGRTSRNKGANYERLVAKKFEEVIGVSLSRTPQSGGHAKAKCTSQNFKGDIVSLEEGKDLVLSIECKNAKNWSLPAWLRQSEEEASEDKIPVVIFHQHGTSNDYVTLSLDNFLELTKDSLLCEV